MRRRDPDPLHRLFFAGLALAGGGCSTYRSAPPDPPPKAPPTASDPITDPAAVEIAATYAGADPAKALPGLEIVGLVTDPGYVDSEPTCSKMPCDPAWLKLAEAGGKRVLILRQNGNLFALTAFTLKDVLGAIDTPEKVALRMQVEPDDMPATCERLAMQGLSCAPESALQAIPVRSFEGKLEVVTFSERDVCADNRFGNATVLGVLAVKPDGELERVDNALSRAAEANIVGKVECRYPSRGRMFEGFEPSSLERSELSYCFRAAREEAAAVVAFERLAAELREHGAPLELVAAAERSAEDERRHARLFTREARRIARALGVDACLPGSATPPRFAPRSLLAMLEENAVEGCANETLAAIVATHQAEHAPSGRLRSLFAAIAADERDHAILAHRIHAWGVGRLDGAEAARLADRHRAACEATATCGETPLGDRMGEPDPAVAAAALRYVVAGLAAA